MRREVARERRANERCPHSAASVHSSANVKTRSGRQSVETSATTPCRVCTAFRNINRSPPKWQRAPVAASSRRSVTQDMPGQAPSLSRFIRAAMMACSAAASLWPRDEVDRRADPGSIQGKSSQDQLRQRYPIRLGQSADQTPVENGEPAVIRSEQVAGMRIGMEHARLACRPQRPGDQRLDDQIAQPPSGATRQRRSVGHLAAVDPLHRRHPGRRNRVDFRNDNRGKTDHAARAARMCACSWSSRTSRASRSRTSRKVSS